MIKLGINIDHVATLRQARGTKYPSVVEAALRAEQAGADSITLHLREDRRHMQDEDIFAIRPLLQTKMNLELAATDEMIAIASRVKPQDVCIVPERREERTTEGGLNLKESYDHLYRATQNLTEQGSRVSLFIAPDLKDIDLAKKMIQLSGLELNKDISIKITGMRPGEKLYEEVLSSAEDTIPTHHPKILRASVREYEYDHIAEQIQQLVQLFDEQNNEKIVRKLKELVPEYKSRNSVYSQLDSEN